MDNTESHKLAQRFKEKAASGLTDVKFYLSNAGETTSEQICREVNRLYTAVDNGECTPLDFDDSHLK